MKIKLKSKTMNKEQVIEGNKLIAEFMRYKLVDKEDKSLGQFWQPQDFNATPFYPISVVDNPNMLKFHSSWDWIMPVVEKINELGWYFTLDVSILDSSAKFVKGTNFIKSPFWSTPLLATYNVVIDFIQWYNQQPK